MPWPQKSQLSVERKSPIPCPRPQTNPPDDAYCTAMPGFGIEFEFRLREAWEGHEDKERGRLAKYARFGMTKEDARRATPEHMREAYQTLVQHQLAEVYTPSPSPSPSALPTPTSSNQDPEEINPPPANERNGLLRMHIKQQSTPDTAASQPVKPVIRIARTRGAAVIESRITKRSKTPRRTQDRNTPQPRHDMETRSMKLARERFG
ncbi:uncharacterized protein BP5553_07268 [Venustampulla echinocandica]|uniref:Uncharacterized protein n=1 Tax=Venustampulla echinocandica TaxID=2656787 RepID=A0A370TIZ7_9HELO|nr:uncharacterized protein BP5553_07268 [Venustampulla echinocandica]RDL35337.1 hypothetical protein BP5553_07268 [Venustampulla echinocandica]